MCSAATPGPWFVGNLDDDHVINLVAVSTVEDTGQGEGWQLVEKVRRLRRLLGS